MRTLSSGERSFMATHIAKGLNRLNVDVTTERISDELAQTDRMLRTASDDTTPPDPYKAGVDKLRRDLAANRAPAVWKRRATAFSTRRDDDIPDPYEAALRKLREEAR